MTPLNISAADWCFFKKTDDPAAYYARLRALGCTAVEMVAPDRWDAARAAGLKLLNISGPGMQDGLNHIARHAALSAEITRAIACAAANGIQQVIVFSGNNQGQPAGEGAANCLKALRELAPVAARAGVTLVFEMLNSSDHPDYQADHAAYGFDLVRAVNSPFLKVLYDVYHMHRMGQDVQRDLLNNLSWVGHIHVAGSPRRDIPGPDQDIDYRTLVRATHAAGYRGFWGMEFQPGAGGLDELAASVTRFQSFLV